MSTRLSIVVIRSTFSRRDRVGVCVCVCVCVIRRLNARMSYFV